MPQGTALQRRSAQCAAPVLWPEELTELGAGHTFTQWSLQCIWFGFRRPAADWLSRPWAERSSQNGSSPRGGHFPFPSMGVFLLSSISQYSSQYRSDPHIQQDRGNPCQVPDGKLEAVTNTLGRAGDHTDLGGERRSHVRKGSDPRYSDIHTVARGRA